MGPWAGGMEVDIFKVPSKLFCDFMCLRVFLSEESAITAMAALPIN